MLSSSWIPLPGNPFSKILNILFFVLMVGKVVVTEAAFELSRELSHCLYDHVWNPSVVKGFCNDDVKHSPPSSSAMSSSPAFVKKSIGGEKASRLIILYQHPTSEYQDPYRIIDSEKDLLFDFRRYKVLSFSDQMNHLHRFSQDCQKLFEQKWYNDVLRRNRIHYIQKFSMFFLFMLQTFFKKSIIIIIIRITSLMN